MTKSGKVKFLFFYIGETALMSLSLKVKKCSSFLINLLENSENNKNESE